MNQSSHLTSVVQRRWPLRRTEVVAGFAGFRSGFTGLRFADCWIAGAVFLSVFGTAVLNSELRVMADPPGSSAPEAFASSASNGLDSNGLDQSLSEQWSGTVQPLLLKHCGDCHMNGASEGGVGLDDYTNLDKIRSHESTWEQIRGVIRAEAMPPPEADSMPMEDRTQLANWIDRALHEVDCNCRPAIPEVTVRRLNQYEYDNTIRDLFGIDVRPSKEIAFVSDDVGNGFDNQGEVLTLPPIAMEKYLQSAAWIAEKVIAIRREDFRKQNFDGANVRHSERMHVPLHLAEGQYNVSIRSRFGDDQKDSCKARLLIDDEPIVEWEVAPKDETAKHEFRVSAGDHVLSIEYLDDMDPEHRNAANRQLIVHSVRVVGPEKGDPAFPKSHERLVIATPEDRDQPEASPIGFTEATRRVFQRFLPRAYRRPVGDEEVQAVMMVCQKAQESGYGYEESLRFGLQAVLVAPQFLFRSETKVASSENAPGIDDFAIACRLSYFLWASMPDEALFQAAKEGGLRDVEVLRAQVARMVADKKAESLLTGFFAQWLGLRNLNKIEVDRDKFPYWSDRLRASMIRETEMFCQSLLAEGKVSDLMMADYTYVNPRLAEFYGVPFDGKDPADMYRRKPGRRGPDPRRQGLYDDEDKWIRIALPENRRGMLTQAAILALTSNPTRSSPVKRGKWILETVLGDPPPSAPPNVPTLEQAKADESASLRERLEIHRSNPSCAGCHKLMDPIGLGLENFDAIGRWRDKDGSQAIASQGELVDGRTFSGPQELVSILAEKEDSVAKNLTERLLTYAIGRGLQRPDRCDVDKIQAHAKSTGYTIRSIVEGVVLSDAFLQRTVEPTVAQSSRSIR